MRTNFTFPFFFFIALFFLLGASIEAQVYYDDWPVTRNSNDRNSDVNKGDFSTDFVPIGTVWNHRIITYFFQNGTADIVGNNERQAVRDGFALWASRLYLFGSLLAEPPIFHLLIC